MSISSRIDALTGLVSILAALLLVILLLLTLSRFVSPWIIVCAGLAFVVLAIPRATIFFKGDEASGMLLVIFATGTILLTWLASILVMAPLMAMLTRRALPALLLLLGYMILSGFFIISLIALFDPIRTQYGIARQGIELWLTLVSILLLVTLSTYLIAYAKFLRLEV
jgi:hypothetical protein